MGKVFDGIDEKLASWIAAQHMFFVATAPRDGGHVNLSPKGLDSFAVLGPRHVAYLDLVGSGAETLAHLRENGRITFMFCAFEGLPRIVRLYGRGETFEPGDPDFGALAEHFPSDPGTRAIVRAELSRVADSCGYGVPLYQFQGERPQLREWAERKGPEGLRSYQLERNRSSLDGLPALRGRSLTTPSGG
jgi:Pyridoxamine 5'-phosphate oxidase